MSEKMSSCPLPFRKKWRERCATPVLKVAVATWTLEIEKQLRVFICVVLQPWAVRKKIKSQVQFCSTLSSPNCPIPLVVYFLVCGVDLVGNCQAKDNCHLAVLPYPCSSLCQQQGKATSAAAGRRGQLITPCATSHCGCGRNVPLLYPPCAGIAASPDPSAMMIQFLQLQGDSCVMCLGSLGSCWFSD